VDPSPSPSPTLPSLAIHREDNRFVREDGSEWKWKGTNDFKLLKMVLDGEDISPTLNQRQATGANLVRVFGTAFNLFRLNPSDYPDYWGGVDRLLTIAESRGMYVEITVFADAQLVIPGLADQQTFWKGFEQFTSRKNLFLELVNENSHVGNTIDTSAFSRLDGPALQSHGSEQTDMHPVDPAWDYVVYHARRNPPPDARGATNYDPSEFEPNYPQPRPMLADEGIKTQDAGYAQLMGKHANIHNGGTFHTQDGVVSNLWSEATARAAAAFFAEIHSPSAGGVLLFNPIVIRSR
jgi:hypothetical protein